MRLNKTSSVKQKPEISTASLPDIIFMLLFFFMVVTVMRDSTLKVQVVIPDATQLTKLENASLVNHMYIGVPKAEYFGEIGNTPQLQLGDKFASMKDIPGFLKVFADDIPEYQRGLITTSLRVDREAEMGIVTDVKVALRKAGQHKLNYSANRRKEL